MCCRIRIEELAECGAIYPGKITSGGGGGLISLTTVDNRRVVGAFSFVFSVCVREGEREMGMFYQHTKSLHCLPQHLGVGLGIMSGWSLDSAMPLNLIDIQLGHALRHLEGNW